METRAGSRAGTFASKRISDSPNLYISKFRWAIRNFGWTAKSYEPVFYYIGEFIDTQKFSAVYYRKMDVENMKYGEALRKSFDLIEMSTYLEDDNKTEISYKALSMELRRKVGYMTITVVELRWDTTGERITDIHRIFENLNSRGTKLSPQEIRNGVYNCFFYDMLRTVNIENDAWKRIRGRESDKEEDMEMLLRLCTVEKK